MEADDEPLASLASSRGWQHVSSMVSKHEGISHHATHSCRAERTN